MKTRTRLSFLTASAILAALAALPVASARAAPEPELDVYALLDRIDDVWRGRSSEARISMRVKTANYERNMTMEAWSLGEEHTLIRIAAPLKEKDSATLKSGNNIYTYLPKTDRTIRLTSGMMGGAWMGSHFTNDDLVKESRLKKDYDPKVTFRGPRDGRPIIEITLIPKKDAAVVWGKIVTTVDEKLTIPVQTVYYDEDMKVARTATFTDVGELGGRTVPRTMTMVPAAKPSELTAITYEKLSFEVKLTEDFFSVAQLKRRR